MAKRPVQALLTLNVCLVLELKYKFLNQQKTFETRCGILNGVQRECMVLQAFQTE
jgi:hypothetical protein